MEEKIPLSYNTQTDSFEMEILIDRLKDRQASTVIYRVASLLKVF